MVSLAQARPACIESISSSMRPPLYEPVRAKIAWIDFTTFWCPHAASEAIIIWARICPLNTTSRPSGSIAGCGAVQRPPPRSSISNGAVNSLTQFPRLLCAMSKRPPWQTDARSGEAVTAFAWLVGEPWPLR